MATQYGVRFKQGECDEALMGLRHKTKTRALHFCMRDMAKHPEMRSWPVRLRDGQVVEDLRHLIPNPPIRPRRAVGRVTYMAIDVAAREIRAKRGELRDAAKRRSPMVETRP